MIVDKFLSSDFANTPILRSRLSFAGIMDDLQQQLEKLESKANLSASVADIQRTIDHLVEARAKIAAG